MKNKTDNQIMLEFIIGAITGAFMYKAWLNQKSKVDEIKDLHKTVDDSKDYSDYEKKVKEDLKAKNDV